MRNKLKEAFMMFCNKVSAKGDIKFEVPLKELGFYGAPNRSTVLIQPTDGCLINLTEWVSRHFIFVDDYGSGYKD